MCGRYLRRSDKQRISEAFRVGKLHDDFVLAPDYNVAPTTFQPVIRESRESTERELVLMRWGLVSHSTKSLADVKGISTINARAESIEKSPTWPKRPGNQHSGASSRERRKQAWKEMDRLNATLGAIPSASSGRSKGRRLAAQSRALHRAVA